MKLITDDDEIIRIENNVPPFVTVDLSMQMITHNHFNIQFHKAMEDEMPEVYSLIYQYYDDMITMKELISRIMEYYTAD